MFWNNYPYTDFHELNLSWVIDKIMEVEKTVKDFEVFNKLTWAGVHDPLKEYEKWSIVQDATGDGYLAIKPVPSGVTLDNEDYWVKVANYDALYAAFDERIEALADRIDDVESDVDSKIKDVKMKHLCHINRYYINCITGDDTNEGTSASPWKTLDPLFTKINSSYDGQVDIRCYLQGTGTYTIPQFDEISNSTINHITLHLTGLSGVNAVLHFPGTADNKFYECHCNIENVTISAPDNNLAFDGGSIALKNVTFNEGVDLYSCQGSITSCTYPWIKATYCNLIIGAPNVTNTDPTINAHEFENCYVKFTGASDTANLTTNGTDNAYMVLISSTLNYTTTYDNINPKYAYAISTSGSNIVTSGTQWNNFKSRSVNGIKYGSSPSEVLISQNTKPVGFIPNIETGKESSVSVPANDSTIVDVTFSSEFSGTPEVFITNTAQNANSSKHIIATAAEVSATGFKLVFTNFSNSTTNVSVNWLALWQPNA